MNKEHLYGIITRLSVFSFALKVIAVAIFATGVFIEELDALQQIALILITGSIWCVDAEYFRIERNVRAVYNSTGEHALEAPELSFAEAMLSRINIMVYPAVITGYLLFF